MTTRRHFVANLAATAAGTFWPRRARAGHEPDHEVITAINRDATTLDARPRPGKSTPNRESRKVLENIHERLVRRDASMQVVAALAERFEVRQDSRGDAHVLELRLRRDVRFHPPVDRPVTSSDVAFSIGLVQSSLSALSADAGVETPESLLVRLKTQSPSLLLSQLADQLIVFPRDYDDQDKHPVGAGAYRFVSRARDVHVVLARFDRYHDRPAVPGLRFVVVPEKVTQVAELVAGRIDITDDPSTKAFAEDIRARKMTLSTAPGGVVLLGMRTTSGGLADSKLRRAVSHAIDRARLAVRVPDLTTPLATIVPPEATASPREKWLPFDRTRARQLIREVAGNSPVRVAITTTAPLAGIAEGVVEELKEINIMAVVRIVEPSTFRVEMMQGALEAYLFRLSPVAWDAHSIMTSYFGQDGPFTTYPRAEVEGLLRTAARHAATPARSATYDQIVRRLLENPPMVPLLRDVLAYGVHPRVRFLWRPRPDGHVLGREMLRRRP